MPVRRAATWAVLAAVLLAPPPSCRGATSPTPSPPPSVTTVVSMAKTELQAALYKVKKNEAAIEAAQASLKALRSEAEGGKTTGADLLNMYKQIPIEDAIAQRKDAILEGKKDRKSLQKEAKASAQEYLDAEDRYYGRYRRYYDPDLIEAATLQLKAKEVEEQEAKKEQPADSPPARGPVQTPGVGAGKEVDFHIDERSLKSRAADSFVEEARPSQALGSGRQPELSHAAYQKMLDPLLRGSPGDRHALMAAEVLREAEAKLLLQDAASALQAAEEFVRLRPGDPSGHLLKARALGRMRKFAQAEAAAKRALELDPGSTSALLELAWAQLHLGKDRDALAAALRAVELDPKSAKAYLLLAFAYEQLGQREKMLESLRKAAELDPKYSGHLARALAGEDLFDPSDQDSWLLLEAVAAPARMPRWPMAAALLAAAAAALAAVVLRRRAPAKPQDAPKPAPKASLSVKYELKRCVSAGSGVWEAVDRALGRTVAIRKIRLEGAAERERIIGEVRALASLSHPNLEEVYEVLEEGEALCIVSEWLSGETVEALLSRKKVGLRPGVVKALLQSVCHVLRQAHAGSLAHGALAPRRIVITKTRAAKLAGFGSWKGRGAAEARPADDIRALGVCAYRMLTGLGEPKESPPAIPAGLTPELKEFLRRALDPDPAKRPQDVMQFWTALESALISEARVAPQER